MNKMLLMVSCFTSIFVLSGCSSQVEQIEKVEVNKKTQLMHVASSAKPNDVLPAFNSFTWSEEYSQVLSAPTDNTERVIQQYIRDEIIVYLQTKGYRYQADPNKADLVIGFLVALEDDLADKKIQDKFGLLPGTSREDILITRYKKGSFLLAVLDSQLKKVYWRSAMQGFVDFEKDRHDDSTHYMQTVLASMMSGFSQAGR
jgi:hypothetical protein